MALVCGSIGSLRLAAIAFTIADMYAHQLWLLLRGSFSNSDYAAVGMLPSRRPSGYGFFPSCEGTWDAPENTPHQNLLFLGHDFGTDDGLTSMGETRSVPTWRHLELLLGDAGVDVRSCFFSNAVMGVRPGEMKSLGRSPAFNSPAFIKKCAGFVCTQLDVVKPHGIVVLGLRALPVLREVERNNISKAGDFKAWDQGKAPCLFPAQLGAWSGPLAMIVHPCFHPRNVHLRSISGDPVEGHTNEVGLLKALVRRSPNGLLQ